MTEIVQLGQDSKGLFQTREQSIFVGENRIVAVNGNPAEQFRFFDLRQPIHQLLDTFFAKCCLWCAIRLRMIGGPAEIIGDERQNVIEVLAESLADFSFCRSFVDHRVPDEQMGSPQADLKVWMFFVSAFVGGPSNPRISRGIHRSPCVLGYMEKHLGPGSDGESRDKMLTERFQLWPDETFDRFHALIEAINRKNIEIFLLKT